MGLSFDTDHHAVVLGAGGAIGAASVRAYQRAGAFVTAADVNVAAAERAVEGGAGQAVRVDVTTLDDIRRFAQKTNTIPVDSILYTVGVAPTSDVLAQDWASYHKTLAVNLHGAMYVAQAFGAAMVDNGRGGSFVFLSSSAGKHGERGAAAYCASKFALIGVVECFAAEMAPHEIRVNALCPGNVDTPMLREVARAEAELEGTTTEEMLGRYAKVATSGRLVTAAEVGATAVWLASEEASGIIGESVNVDAGALTG